MRLNKDVCLLGLQVPIAIALVVGESVALSMGYQDGVWLKTAVEQTHSKSSLHYVGLAIDIDLGEYGSGPDHDLLDFAEKLDKALSDEFDVVYEGTHVHVEWQPKVGVNL